MCRDLLEVKGEVPQALLLYILVGKERLCAVIQRVTDGLLLSLGLRSIGV